MTEFVVTDPSGKEFVVNAPEGATQEQALEFAKSQFGGTKGGAATGNPSLARQGDRSMRPTLGAGDAASKIGGAGILGGVAGAFAPEILMGAGGLAGIIPGGQPLAPWLMGAGQALRGQRLASGVAGAASGLLGETSGQAVEAGGGSQTAAELARIAGGAVGPELGTVVKLAARATGKIPIVADVLDYIRTKGGKDIKLSEAQKVYVEQQIEGIRGGAKTDATLERVGSIMGDQGERLMNEAEWRMLSAQFNKDSVKPYGGTRELADVGGELQGTINKRYKGALDARRTEYANNEAARDAIVLQREGAGQYVNTTPEYNTLVTEIQSQLKGNRSPSVAASYQKILSELADEKGGQITFQRLDDVRRKLGDAFRGKPAEGYDAIGEQAAKELYGKVSNIQKQYAGAPQAKLLDDYAERTEGLNIFSSKYGKKSTALDQYREDTFATDPSTLPTAYFKTRASVQALKELTGDQKQVNSAALEYVNKQLAGKDGAAARKWLGENAEWLAEVGPARTLADRYVTRLEGADRALRNAEDFATKAAKDSKLLIRDSLPAQRAVDLIKSGSDELWAKVTPAIVQSPQAKAQMVNAVRQVVADQATAKATGDLFNRNIRGFLEKSGIATKPEMDAIAQRLSAIQAMQVPEAEKLGLAKRLILQGTSGWAASAVSRGGVNAYQWSKDRMVPE